MAAVIERARRGRPKLGASVCVGFTPAQLEFLDRQAEARATSFAAIVREAVAAQMAKKTRRAA